MDTGQIIDVTWARGPNLPHPIKGQAQGVIDGRIVYAGGFAFDNTGYERPAATLSKAEVDPLMRPRQMRYCNEAWLFDPESSHFTRLPDAPVAAFWPEGTATGGDFYLLTGTMRDPANARLGWQTGEKVDLTSPRVFRLCCYGEHWQWSELFPMRIGRFLPSVAVVDYMLYVIGGQANFGGAAYSGDRPGPYINAVEALDLNCFTGWRDVAPLPGIGRSNAAVTVADGKVYLFGGFYDHIYHDPKTMGLFCGDAYCFDPQTLRWEQLPDLPFGLSGATAVTIKDRFILLVGDINGGEKVVHPFTGDRSGKPKANYDVLCFDAQDGMYRTLPTKLSPGPIDPFDPQYPETDPSYSARGYWLTKGDAIGDTVYLLGGEVTDFAYSNCSDAVWIGAVTFG